MKVWLVLKFIPYDTSEVVGCYGDKMSAECHRDTATANERWGSTYSVEEWFVGEWEGGQ